MGKGENADISISSFSHNVFYHIQNRLNHLSQFQLSSANADILVQSKMLLRKRLKLKICLSEVRTHCWSKKSFFTFILYFGKVFYPRVPLSVYFILRFFTFILHFGKVFCPRVPLSVYVILRFFTFILHFGKVFYPRVPLSVYVILGFFTFILHFGKSLLSKSAMVLYDAPFGEKLNNGENDYYQYIWACFNK